MCVFPRDIGQTADRKGHMLPQREQWRIRPVFGALRRFFGPRRNAWDFLDNPVPRLKPWLDMPQQCR